MHSKLDEMNELFDLESRDALIMIARHYRWNTQAMYSWFDQRSELEVSLGITQDQNQSIENR